MCCIVTSLLKIFLIFVSILILLIINFQMLWDLNALSHSSEVTVRGPEAYFTLWIFHCWCGTLMTVLRLKDLCYLHWWILMTSVDIIAGLAVTFKQQEIYGFGMGEKLANYFVLEYMLITLFTVASYAKTLRAQQEE